MILKRLSRFFLDKINVIKLLTGNASSPWAQLSCTQNGTWVCVYCSMNEQRRWFELLLHRDPHSWEPVVLWGPTDFPVWPLQPLSLTYSVHALYATGDSGQVAETILSTSTANVRNHVPPKIIRKYKDLMNSDGLQGFELLMHHIRWQKQQLTARLKWGHTDI